MLSQHEIMQTIQMIDQQHLDVRTITMGISLLSCARSDPKQACGAIYDKITRYAEKLVSTGEAIEKEFGIPIVNKRISVTPIALVAAAAETDNYAPFAAALDRAAKTTGVNFIGGFSALVQKGMTEADRKLIASIPEALSTTDLVCASVNVGSTKAGIDMDAVALMGRTIKDLAGRTAGQGGFGCAKLVVFCNAVEDNPFMAGAFHGVGEPEKVINVGGLRPRRGAPRPSGGEGAALRRGGRDHQKDRLPHHPHGPAGGPGGQPPAGHPLRHRGPVPGPPPPPLGTAWPASWRRWAWRCAAPTAPPPPWPCSTTR